MQNFDFTQTLEILKNKGNTLPPFEMVCVNFSEEPNKPVERQVAVAKAPSGHFYVIDWENKDEFVGEGAAGTVYRTYQIDPKTGKARMGEQDPQFVMKILSCDDSPNSLRNSKFLLENTQKESKILRKLYPATELPFPVQVMDSKQIVLIMPRVAGEALAEYSSDSDDIRLHPKLSQVTFQKGALAIAQLAGQIQRLHHKTLDGNHCIHGDVKSPNIHLHVSKQDEVIASLVDAGSGYYYETLETTQSDENPDVQELTGSPLFMAPEIAKPLLDKQKTIGGRKSDIFSFTEATILLLGGKEPTKTRNTVPFKEFYNNFFDYNDIQVPDYQPYKIREYLFTFISERMLQIDYAKRGDSDELERFFLTLSQFCLAFEQYKVALEKLKNLGSGENHNIVTEELADVLRQAAFLEEQCDIYAAKLALLSAGVWKKSIGNQDIASISRRNDVETVTQIQTTFEHYDFDSNPASARTILAIPLNTLKQKSGFSEELKQSKYNAQKADSPFLTQLKNLYQQKLKASHLSDYITTKSELLVDGSRYSGTFFGYTNQVKMNAGIYLRKLTERLIKDPTDVAELINFFEDKIPDAKKIKAPLYNGKLYEQTAKPLLDLLEIHYKSIKVPEQNIAQQCRIQLKI